MAGEPDKVVQLHCRTCLEAGRQDKLAIFVDRGELKVVCEAHATTLLVFKMPMPRVGNRSAEAIHVN